MSTTATPKRCFWVDGSDLYDAYHDREWGRPVSDDVRLFEKISLEGFQAGLSWITILRKRENFRAGFDGFDFHKVAHYGDADVQRLLADPGIIRHRGKIEATIAGAAAYLRIEAKTGFSTFIWGHADPATPPLATMANAPAQTPQSVALSRSLKAEGFKFCGPTITYAFMQAAGMVNDHLVSCPRHAELSR